MLRPLVSLGALALGLSVALAAPSSGRVAASEPTAGQEPAPRDPATKPSADDRPSSTPDARGDADATIDDFAWLAGLWRGEGFGGTCEEMWSPPLAGTMVGTFRLIQGDEVVFYEIMLLGRDAQGVSLKVKHFSEDFVAWEEKAACVRFPLTQVSPGDARFGGLTLKRDGDRLEAAVHLEQGGATRWETIRMTRVAPADEG